jgi:hypothetical protein
MYVELSGDRVPKGTLLQRVAHSQARELAMAQQILERACYADRFPKKSKTRQTPTCPKGKLQPATSAALH